MNDRAERDQPETPDAEYREKSMDLGMQIAEFDPTPYLRQLRGRGGSQTDYLDVKHRLLWLRTEHPDAEIVTEHIRIDESGAIFKATVTIPGGGRATGHGSETAQDFTDYIEKAETKALGRALNALGYGAQFADGDAGEQRAGPASGQTRTGEQGANRPGRRSEPPKPVRNEAPPTANVSENPSLEDYSWNAFWQWARSQGHTSKDDLDRAIGRSTAGMNPAQIRDLLAKRSG
ncbi:hypothetical protein BH23CHL4_BH23CHL4_01950 [soil metagenome]